MKIFKTIQELGSSVAIGQSPDVLYLLELNRRILWLLHLEMTCESL